MGNKAAHTGNVTTDIAMIVLGYIQDTDLFEEIYGIAHDTMQHYSSICFSFWQLLYIY